MRRSRLFALHSLALLVPIGLGLKYYIGPAHHWVSHSLAGALYVMFWCIVLFAIWPHRRDVTPIVLTVLVVTCILEFLQRWHHPLLEWIRDTWIGRTLIGATFDPYDFLYYGIGAFLAWSFLHALASLDRETSHAHAD